MSKATSIYDALVAKVIATLPTYIELPESYSVEENPTYLMTKAFAVGFLSETNNEYHATNLLNFEREFSVVLVNKIAATINSRSERAAIEKALIEDAYTLIKALCNDLTLGQVASLTSYQGQTGIEYITSANGTERFISVVLTIAIKYQDTF
jgi:hypothetical protein